MITFYEYPKCTTCKNAKKWLIENNIEFKDIDLTKDTPTVADLKAFHEKSKVDLKKFFNTSGMIYRDLNLKDKLPTMSDEEKFELLASNGMLIKRPLVVCEDTVLLGFKETDWNNTLK